MRLNNFFTSQNFHFIDITYTFFLIWIYKVFDISMCPVKKVTQEKNLKNKPLHGLRPSIIYANMASLIGFCIIFH